MRFSKRAQLKTMIVNVYTAATDDLSLNCNESLTTMEMSAAFVRPLRDYSKFSPLNDIAVLVVTNQKSILLFTCSSNRSRKNILEG